MSTRKGKVLILSPHVMTAALVGWYVELATLEPAYVLPDEHPEAALARVKPVLVVLIDSDFDEALSDLLALRASRRGTGIAVFGPPSSYDGREWAERQGIPFFHMPIELEAFCRALDVAARSGREERRQINRRRSSTVDRAVDGTLLLYDDGGRAWYVYDRRAGDRRLLGDTTISGFRAFISEDGIERRCELSETEFSDSEPAQLAAQLARAAQVPPNHS